jgi:predicted GNAT family N-acyltransferase
MGTLLLTDVGTDNSVFQDAYSLRITVFSEEQGIPQDNELDEFDDAAYHCVTYIDERPVACGRLNIINDGAKICRLAVMKNFRKSGYATELCNHFISLARQNGAKYIYLHAQTYITNLYQKIGFTCEGDTFLEEGIPHILMIKKLCTPPL